MLKKWKKFSQNFTSIHRFCLPSSTISSYFNSSYYSFFTFLTLYPISFNISQKNFVLRANGGLIPKHPLPTPLDGPIMKRLKKEKVIKNSGRKTEFFL